MNVLLMQRGNMQVNYLSIGCLNKGKEEGEDEDYSDYYFFIVPHKSPN